MSPTELSHVKPDGDQEHQQQTIYGLAQTVVASLKFHALLESILFIGLHYQTGLLERIF